jgi:hypothetical protein
MNQQPDLFGPKIALPTRRDMEQVVSRMFPDYVRTVCDNALKVAGANEDFTSEDVRQFCEPAKGQENTFSSAMLEAKRLGIFKVIGYRNSARKEAKGRMIPVYQRAFEL